jgi:hypothetical protein
MPALPHATPLTGSDIIRGVFNKKWNYSQDAQKGPTSKAASSEEARRTLRYSEVLSDARTPLADFFSILLVCFEKEHRQRG